MPATVTQQGTITAAATPDVGCATRPGLGTMGPRDQVADARRPAKELEEEDGVARTGAAEGSTPFMGLTGTSGSEERRRAGADERAAAEGGGTMYGEEGKRTGMAGGSAVAGPAAPSAPTRMT